MTLMCWSNLFLFNLFLNAIVRISPWKRGYPDYLIKEQVEKALKLTPSDENNSKKVNSIPLVVTYNPAFKNLFELIKKSLQLLYADEEVKKVFSPVPFFSFRSTRNLKSYLVRSKITLLREKLVLKSVRVNVA